MSLKLFVTKGITLHLTFQTDNTKYSHSKILCTGVPRSEVYKKEVLNNPV